MGVEIVMEIVLKRGLMLGCDVAVVKSVNRTLPTLLDLMLLGSVILALFPCQMAMTIGS